jgi:hypothetical protein
LLNFYLFTFNCAIMKYNLLPSALLLQKISLVLGLLAAGTLAYFGFLLVAGVLFAFTVFPLMLLFDSAQNVYRKEDLMAMKEMGARLPADAAEDTTFRMIPSADSKGFDRLFKEVY